MNKKIWLILIALIIILVIILILFIPKKKLTQAEEVYGISGTITKIRNDRIIIKASIIYTSGTQKTRRRIAMINQETLIAELEFPEITPENRTEPIVPKQTRIELEELEKEQKVDITTKENISGLKKFTAESIIVNK